jgi:hypothetical protein
MSKIETNGLHHKQSSKSREMNPNSLKFSIQNNTNCLQISEMRKSIRGNHFRLDLGSNRNFDRCAPIALPTYCDVYVTKSCQEEVFILIDEHVAFVNGNQETYIQLVFFSFGFRLCFKHDRRVIFIFV